MGKSVLNTWNKSLAAFPAQYIDIVLNGSIAHRDEMFTTTMQVPFLFSDDDDDENLRTNCDDNQLEDVTLKSTAFLKLARDDISLHFPK